MERNRNREKKTERIHQLIEFKRIICVIWENRHSISAELNEIEMRIFGHISRSLSLCRNCSVFLYNLCFCLSLYCSFIVFCLCCKSHTRFILLVTKRSTSVRRKMCWVRCVYHLFKPHLFVFWHLTKVASNDLLIDIIVSAFCHQ